jgi:molybdopterin converting factor small subunit
VKIRLQYFSLLRDLRGPEAIDVAGGETIAGLLASLYAEAPVLAQWDKHLLIAAGTEYVDRDYVVKPDDLISLMPPVQGG